MIFKRLLTNRKTDDQSTNGLSAVLLVNLGTPDKPTIWKLYRYLTQFLNDYRVIDLPFFARFLLVNLIIIPFRVIKSTRRYKTIWTPKGSPLLYHTINMRDNLQQNLGKDTSVYMGMRYGNPSIKSALRKIKKGGYSKLTIIPLHPQYASATNGTIMESVLKELRGWNTLPTLKIITEFSTNQGFIKAYTQRIKSYQPQKFDHIIFSYHSLPVRHINRIHPEVNPNSCTCTHTMPEHGHLCYKAGCYNTSRHLAKELNLSPDDYTVSFQSRLSGQWLSPFTEDIIEKLAKEGKKRVLIAAPSFITDCLETIYDLGMESQEIFSKHGGEKLKLVECLNDHPDWIEAIKKML